MKIPHIIMSKNVCHTINLIIKGGVRQMLTRDDQVGSRNGHIWLTYVNSPFI